jgi:PAS domain S-box-containing protein
LVDRLPAILGYWDLQLRNRLANRAYETFLGIAPGTIHGTHIADALGASLYEQHRQYIRRAIGGESQRFDFEAPTPSGESRRMQASYLPDVVDGAVRGLFALVAEISAHGRAEGALGHSEGRFRALFELAPIGSLIVDADGRIRELSPAAEIVLRRPRAELIGLPVLDITHPDDREAAHARLAGLVAGDITRFKAEKRFIDLAGNTIWTQVDGTVLGAGEDFQLVEQVQDVSERRRHEQRLAQYRLLLESAPDAMVIVAEDGAIRLVNARTEELFGYRRDELVGQRVELLVPERFRAGHAGFRAAYVGDPHVRPMGAGLDLRGRRRDGTEFPVEISLSPLHTDQGSLFSVAIRDVSERDAAERTAQQLAAIVESSDSAIIAKTLEGTILTWNGAAERIYGYTAEEAIGHDIGMLASDQDVLDRRFARVRDGESVEPFETAQMTKSGRQIDVEMEISPIRGRGEAVVGVSMIARDITASKREQLEFERKLIESQKLEALGVLAGGIAHDFNNLLGVVLGNTSLALATLPTESSLRETLQQVEQAALRSAELANQMLAYSGKGKFVIQPMALSELVQGIAELIQGTISKKATLTTVFAADTPTIEGDVTQLRQVVLNLITNASEAIGDETGTIAIVTGKVEADQAYLADFEHAGELPSGRYAFLEVSDSGGGMTDETRARIFEPFFTTKFTGRGLGLAAVQGIVRSHGGAIKLYSERGHGTSFKLLFPVADAAAQATISRTGPGPSDWRGSGTVVVADDSDGMRHMASVMLESLGFVTIGASNGSEALAALRQHDGKLAFALVDLMMPGMTGGEVVAELERLGATTPIVLSSGYNAQQVTQELTGSGVAAFLQKPYELDQLRSIARQVTEGAHGGERRSTDR